MGFVHFVCCLCCARSADVNVSLWCSCRRCHCCFVVVVAAAVCRVIRLSVLLIFFVVRRWGCVFYCFEIHPTFVVCVHLQVGGVKRLSAKG